MAAASPPLAADADPTPRRRILRASAWTAAGYAASLLLRLGSNLVMTRLLVPEMFGAMAITHLLMVGLALLSDIGLRQNIIQSRRGDDPAFLNSAWTVQILRGVLLWAVALGIAGALALAQRAGLTLGGTAYNDPVLPAVIAVVASSALIFGFQSTRVATAHRHLQQGRVVGIELAAQAVSVGVMILWATQAPTIWALAAGSIVASLVSALLSHTVLAGPRNRFAWEPAAVRELLHFGKWILLSSAIGVLAASADRLLLGGLVDARLLGLYAIGQIVVSTIETGAGRFFMNVSLPALSKAAHEDPERLKAMYYRLQTPLDIALFFAAGALLTGGQALIALLYDPRYAGAGPILATLAISLAGVRFGLAHQCYLALARPRLLTLINAVRLAALLCLMPVFFYFGGFSGAVWAVALHNFMTVPLIYRFNRRFGLFNPRLETRAIPLFFIGLACGWLATWLSASLGFHPLHLH